MDVFDRPNVNTSILNITAVVVVVEVVAVVIRGKFAPVFTALFLKSSK